MTRMAVELPLPGWRKEVPFASSVTCCLYKCLERRAHLIRWDVQHNVMINENRRHGTQASGPDLPGPSSWRSPCSTSFRQADFFSQNITGSYKGDPYTK